MNKPPNSRYAATETTTATLPDGREVACLRRRFVPVWLLHRYQMVAAAKAIGGVYLSYAVNGGGHEASDPVPAKAQRAALDAVLATLAPDALRVPQRLCDLDADLDQLRPGIPPQDPLRFRDSRRVTS